MRRTCAIVRDLWPAYRTGKLSEQSGAFVEAHLEACEECGEVWTAQAEKTGRKPHRYIRVRTLWIAVAAAVAVCLALAGTGFYLAHLEVPILGSEMDLFSIGQTEDGRVYFSFGSTQYFYGNGYSWSVSRIAENLYIEARRPFLGRLQRSRVEAEAAARDADVMQRPQNASYLEARVEDGVLRVSRVLVDGIWALPDASDVEDGDADWVNIKKIYLGREEPRLVWEAGDEIQVMPYGLRERRW